MALLYVSTQNYLTEVPLSRVKEFETAYLNLLAAQHQDTLAQIAAGEWNDAIKKVLAQEAKILLEKYQVKTLQEEGSAS
ncbi:MAG: hypothetical protein AAFQ08_00265 [Bacteroidota bacterium]